MAGLRPPRSFAGVAVTPVAVVLLMVGVLFLARMVSYVETDLPRETNWRGPMRLRATLRGLSFALAFAGAWEAVGWWVNPQSAFQAVLAVGCLVVAWRIRPPAVLEVRVTELRARTEAIEDRAEWCK
jgi:hypothetical protein